LKKLNNLNKYQNCRNPRVSIGVPVFNGENYLKEALNSILSQKYQNFEIIIVDNASTDNTQQICQYYANKDDRIHYYRNKKNIGATLNFIKVFKLAKGEYFKWAAYDDVLFPDFLLKCVNILDQDPSIILCHSRTGRINEHGEVLGYYKFENKINSRKPHERFGAIINDLYNSWVLIFGVIRTDSLKISRLFGNFVGADKILVAELGLIGRMYEIPECLFYRRTHKQAYTETKRTQDSSTKLRWWTQSGRINFPNFKILIEYFRSIRQVPMRFNERFLCYIHTFRWFLQKGWILICFDVGTNLLEYVRLGSKFQTYVRSIAKLMHFSEI